MKKLEIIFFVLGIGIAFADIYEKNNPVPEDSSVLNIITYTSEVENGKENDVPKPEVEENINEPNIMQDIQPDNPTEIDKVIESGTIDMEGVLNGVLENENLNVINWDGYPKDDDFVPMQESDFNYKDLMDSDPNEIMETAAGFVPIPILKRRQKPRRKFANRRYFRRPVYSNPYRRYYHYYPYYRYYYPGSLRFY